MKVYGITTTANPSWGAETREVRVVVAARSKREAAAALRAAGIGYSDYAFGQYAGQIWNDAEIQAANAAPGRVLFASEGGVRTAEDYRPVPLRG